MAQPLNIIIIDRLGSLKMHSIKDFKQEDLFKKCGFKKADNFIKQTEWNVKHEGSKYILQLFAKKEGKANSENKYDFPPPVDTTLLFGSCAVVCLIKKPDGSKAYTNLSIPLWNIFYEKLFGGFEDINKSIKEDEAEVDELKTISKVHKTKHGYLKDGFVIDSSDQDEETESNEFSDDEECDENDDGSENSDADQDEDELVLNDIGSELSEESYDYPSPEKVDKL